MVRMKQAPNWLIVEYLPDLVSYAWCDRFDSCSILAVELVPTMRSSVDKKRTNENWNQEKFGQFQLERNEILSPLLRG